MSKVRGGKQHKELLLWELPEVVAPEVDSRGRSADLIAQRDEHLLHRYVYYIKKYPQWRSEAIVEILGKEFYLSVSTIGQKLEECGGELQAIRREWPELKELRSKWGWMVW